MIRSTHWIAPVVLSLATLAFAEEPPAAEVAASGESGASGESVLVGRVLQAYRDTQQYQATIAFSVEQQDGRVTNIQKMDFYVAFDRPGQQLLVDKPDMRIIAGGGELKMTHYQAPNHYVKAPVADPLEWSSLMGALEQINSPVLPDVAMLVAGDPGAVLSRTGAMRAGAEADTIVADLRAGELVMHVNPDTRLIDRAELEIQGRGKLTYVFDVRKHNEPLDAELFTFDPRGAQEVGSLMELGAAVQRAGPPPSNHPLLGKPAPKVTFKTIDDKTYTLGETGHRVVVLDFWGTWCGPCRLWLPDVQKIHDWAQEEKLSVLVVAADSGDLPEDALAYWKENDFTMPMTLDEGEALFSAFLPPVFPQTFVIVDGEVRYVHDGALPGVTDKELRKQILESLEGKSTNEGDKPGEPSSKRAPGA